MQAKGLLLISLLPQIRSKQHTSISSMTNLSFPQAVNSSSKANKVSQVLSDHQPGLILQSTTHITSISEGRTGDSKDTPQRPQSTNEQESKWHTNEDSHPMSNDWDSVGVGLPDRSGEG